MYTAEQFVKQLGRMRKSGRTLESIGEDLSVTRQAVFRWINGAKPSKTVLMLAGMKWSRKGGKA
jgi:hypothetical protein